MAACVTRWEAGVGGSAGVRTHVFHSSSYGLEVLVTLPPKEKAWWIQFLYNEFKAQLSLPFTSEHVKHRNSRAPVSRVSDSDLWAWASQIFEKAPVTQT